MKIAVLGCGSVGSILIQKLVSSKIFEKILAIDVKASTIERLAIVEKVEAVKLDVGSDIEGLRRLLKEVDLVCEALPSTLGFRAVETSLEVGVDTISVSYFPQDPFQLENKALDSGSLLIPDCGIAPGLSNILAGRASSLMEELLELHIKVGGIPSTSTPPLKHASAWSINDLLEEYTRKARLVRGGRVVEVDPLSSYEVLYIPEVGAFEGFYTDGLRTLLKTLKARDMDETTIRRRGHMEAVRALAECGLLSREPVEVDGVMMEPRKLLKTLLARAWRGFEEDLLILLVEASGLVREGVLKLGFNLILQGELKVVPKATAYVCFHVASMVTEGLVKDVGVYPLERLGMDPKLYEELSFRMGSDGLRWTSTSSLKPLRS